MLKDKLRLEDGNTILVVVLMMSMLFMIGTIVYSYTIREYRFTGDWEREIQGDLQRYTALSDAVSEICLRLDAEAPIGVFNISRSGIGGNAELSYSGTVYEYGTYDEDDYHATSNQKNYRFRRQLPDPPPDPIPEVHAQDIAVSIKTTNDGESRTWKLLISIHGFDVDFYDVTITKAE